MTDIPKQYDPAATQQKWFTYWQQHGHFNADPNPEKRSHTIMIPLPNVTGALHMGHALNGTLQDLITRWKRMQGFEALWMPGTDHAGIATQAVVERRMLEEEGLTRHDIGREALVNRIWRWKDAYEKRIIGQLQSLGASCDWRRTRFTLDDVCAKAVRRTFFQMFRDGLIYRGKRLVNWDTHLQTAVADDEVYSEDVAGHFWSFHYPIVDEAGRDTGQSIRFSTTRPETMLGDTAICVHPTDERYRQLIGKQVRIPLNGRLIPIIADALLADKELGTGAVKVTPAHDPNDYACYMRQLGTDSEIGVINILNPDGTLNADCGNQKYVGKDRYAAREQIIEEMAERGYFDGVEDRVIPIKHSDRSKTPVEPYLSDQWFVRMGDNDDGTPGLAQSAITAVEDGRVRFYPSRYAKTYLDWLGEKRDWCISRQLWWGHRIPVWSKTWQRDYNIEEGGGEAGDSHPDIDETEFLKPEFQGKITRQRIVYPQAGATTELACIADDSPELEAILESAGFSQDPDVLDTWFSSALWPHATLGWPDTDHNPPLDADVVASQSPPSADGGTEAPVAPPMRSAGLNRVLDYFYPGSVLITSRDIITLWVARMVLTGLYNMGDVPFRHVHVHPKILDGFGQTMSKSKGNGVDPVDIIERYGTDAVRFTIASFAGETQDVRLPISYECPHCDELIPSKLYKTDTQTVVVPGTLQGSFPVPQGAPKPTLACPKCKQSSQFTTPLYDPDLDVPVAKTISERFEYGRNFCNKFWNAARFAMLNLEGYTPAPVAASELHLEDRWILSRLSTVAQQMDESLGRYQFDAATRAIRDFTWNEFCDWYLEMIKPRLRSESVEPTQAQGSPSLGFDERATAQRVLLAVLDTLVRLLQPFTPFICEELWQRLREIAPERSLPVTQDTGDAALDIQPTAEACIIAEWPSLPRDWQDRALEQRFGRLQETIVAVRNVRAVYGIPPTKPVKLLMRTAEDMQSVAGQFDNLAKAVLEAAGADVERPQGAASFSLGDADGYIPLEGLIDRKAELARQQKEADQIRKHIQGAEAKLANTKFTANAPEAVVAGVRETLENLQRQLASVEEILADLS